ncbi:hypothetical protein Tco_0101113, partial [Tanacetum coccineum]
MILIGIRDEGCDNLNEGFREKNSLSVVKRIFDKRMKNQAKTDKTEHGMEKHGKAWKS